MHSSAPQHVLSETVPIFEKVNTCLGIFMNNSVHFVPGVAASIVTSEIVWVVLSSGILILVPRYRKLVEPTEVNETRRSRLSLPVSM
jgi:hypothetical protein